MSKMQNDHRSGVAAGLPVEDDMAALRHSLAHLLAAAVMELWPDTKRTIGPAIENGFYYDFEFTHPLSEAHLQEIEDKMRQILPTWDQFERKELSVAEAKAEYPGNQFKHELIDEFSDGGKAKVSFYRSGNFRDLCRGGHVESMKQVDPAAFKLTKLAGAYWRGDAQKAQLTRVYGVAFTTPSELDNYLKMMIEAEKRDHRKLGQELDLFNISELVGSGLPMFTPKGSVLREGLGAFSQELQQEHGFERVWTPHIAHEQLYKTSGHFDKFPERFSVTSEESDDRFMMKPMNCPHHIQLFARKSWSYRELPVRYMENTTNYRDEKSGELLGLSRVRSLSQDDGHIFCREEHINDELTALVEMVERFYSTLGMSYYARLSYRDESDQYLGDPALWQSAEKTIAAVARAAKLKSVDGPGEAAFYGPKIDFMVRDSLGREWQCATIQLDFVQPERFGLSYTDSDGSERRPVMIHKAILGSIERFLAVYIEHTAGKFPLWLAPEQVRVITVSDEAKVMVAAQKLVQQLRESGLRPELDESNESVGKKIRAAELMKVPYTVVIGEKEIESGKVTPRVRSDYGQGEAAAIPMDEFIQKLADEAKSRATRSSL